MTTANHDGEFIQFATSIRDSLQRQAYRLCRDWHAAEDLTQTTLAKLYSHRQRLAEHRTLGAYARQTLLTTHLDERRRLRWRYEITSAQLPEQPVEDSIADDRLALAAAVGQLTAQQRTIVTLRFLEDLSIAQTAAVLDCPQGTVTSQTYRALKSLRAALSQSQPR
jgi:RNA polymerase sigma-70 factor (sigma-E family)